MQMLINLTARIFIGENFGQDFLLVCITYNPVVITDILSP